MPPHCDTMDGPVVSAAKTALEKRNVDLVLPFVPDAAEEEIRGAFERTIKARVLGPEAREVSDLYLFETVVRTHRMGEGAPYTGLKPAGQSEGPAIPLAEAAVAGGSVAEVSAFLAQELHAELERRLESVRALAGRADESVAAAREYVEAMLGFEVYTHKTYLAIHAQGHHRPDDGRH
ncbi:DUF6448 family protein [Arthrobacter mangrovi]|uniref:Uncharacterized protein n=1 Tax=Arthrobacter mangrovi TaxID=2966350 RepID=A0ABQ5MNL8_9MICC|nr:DUF6448 family protein [Arthrobacter mangrovi]GLB65583.1 hypothetical protein AHIS1636_00220 [Arthrobacter mangrovi]